MAQVGPQYQSQLALLAGALGHGLSGDTGLQLYQQTLAQADAARQAAAAERQQTLGALAQLATQQAAAGATPDQVSALVRSTAAGLPRSDSNAVQQGIHGILGHLANYQATVDPTVALGIQNQQLQNQALQQQIDQGAATSADPNALFGSPSDLANITNAVKTYDAQGMTLPEIRAAIAGQAGIGLSSPLKPVFDQTISQAYAALHPDWAAQNLAAYGATPGPPPAPAQPDHLLGDVAAGTALGAGLGALGGPFAPFTIPGGAALGALGGLIGHAVYGSLNN